MNLPSPDEFFPKTFLINSNDKKQTDEARIEYELFKREFRIISAESMLKTFDGELTPQVLVALRIAEKRLLN